MMLRLLFALPLVLTLSSPLLAASASGPNWLRDDRVAFDRAATEQRFVLLYLEAVWCHWCHVMDQETYSDPRVQASIDAHFVPLRIDQDARPDLANRYRDYGWPATIVLAADGSEIVKRRGFVSADSFARLLQAIVDDPTPEVGDRRDADAPPPPKGALPDSLRAELGIRHKRRYDEALGGLDHTQKYLERDSVEWALTLAAQGDEVEGVRARQTLDAALALLDPVWGGFYQYSTHGDWQHPHFEKLTVQQGEYLRIYSLAYAQFGDARYLQAARRVADYASEFLLAEEGGYRASQDADLRPGEHSESYFALDDAGRRAQGIPRVAPQRFARETAAMIEGLAALAEAADDREALARARDAARWAMAQRSLPGGGFRHDEVDAAGPFLGDSLRMSRALLALYRADADRRWLDAAVAAMHFIDSTFRAQAGFRTAVQGGAPIAPLPALDENISLARHANLLSHASGDKRLRAMADHALAYLSADAVALATFTEAGILLADHEMARDPLHLTVVGAKSDAQAGALYRAVLEQPGSYRRIDWWDRDEGPLPNPDVEYPKLSKAAAFVCNERQCSVPITSPEGVAEFLAFAESEKNQ